MSRSCPFASASVSEHLARGAGAAALLALTFWLFQGEGALRAVGAVVSLVAAVVLMRGCPTCWTTGLFATIAVSRRRARQAADTSLDGARPAAVPAPR